MHDYDAGACHLTGSETTINNKFGISYAESVNFYYLCSDKTVAMCPRHCITYIYSLGL